MLLEVWDPGGETEASIDPISESNSVKEASLCWVPNKVRDQTLFTYLLCLMDFLRSWDSHFAVFVGLIKKKRIWLIRNWLGYYKDFFLYLNLGNAFSDLSIIAKNSRRLNLCAIKLTIEAISSNPIDGIIQICSPIDLCHQVFVVFLLSPNGGIILCTL